MTQPPTLPYAMPGATPAAYTPTDGLARWTMMLLWIGVIVSCLSVGSGYMQLTLLQRALAGDNITMADANANDQREQIIGIIQLGLLLPTMILFLIWLHRSYRNLKPLGAWKVDYSPGWAVGYWFIPILNLFRPYQVVREIWQKSDPQVPPGSVATPPVPSILGWWWAAWLIGNFADQIVFRGMLRAEGVPALLGLTYASMFSDAVHIISGALLIQIVKRITTNQQTRHQMPATGAMQGSSPLNSL